MKPQPFALLCLLIASSLAGCTGTSAPTNAATDPEAGRHAPGVDTLPSGRTIHLKAKVVDLEQEVAKGFTANLWAFCFGPADPKDEASVAAIEPWKPLPGDKVANLAAGMSCSVPGPTLRVHQGDRVVVDLANSHMHPHSIHWHGQLVNWTQDGAPGVSQDPVGTGKSFTYDFIAKKAGTLWYHCHVDGQEHIMKGLFGAMIVEPRDTSQEPKNIGHEVVWVLSTANHVELMQMVPNPSAVPMGLGAHAGHLPTCMSGTPDCEQPPSAAGNPDLFMINGHSFPFTMSQEQTLIKIKEGERVRLRIVNAGETVETIHPHGHDMLITHRDGNVLPAGLQYYVDTLDIAPGQRIDVVLEGTNPGVWMIHTHVPSHETTCGRSGGGIHSMIVYDGFESKMHGFRAELPATCNVSTAPSAAAALGKVLGGETEAATADPMEGMHHAHGPEMAGPAPPVLATAASGT